MNTYTTDQKTTLFFNKLKMTFELKKKDLKDYIVIKFGYCEKYEIFRYLQEIGYTHGIYGRNETIYNVFGSNVKLSTGYRPTGERALNDKKREKLNEYLKSEKWREKTIKRDYDKKRNYVNKKVYDLIQEHLHLKHKENDK